jgi:hypothetical protein
MHPQRISFGSAVIGSAIFLGIWYGCLLVVATAIVLIARIPLAVAWDFFSTRRTILAVGVIGPLGFLCIVWIRVVVGWLLSAVERRL